MDRMKGEETIILLYMFVVTELQIWTNFKFYRQNFQLEVVS